MAELAWTPVETREEAELLALADRRLEGWANWQRDGKPRIGFPTQSPIVSVMKPADEEAQAGARHVAIVAGDEAALEVDRIVAQLRRRQKRWYKVIRVEYLTYGPRDIKAERLGFSVHEFRHRLRWVQLVVAEALKRGHMAGE